MKILIATDGSEFSKAAIEECCKNYIRPDAEVRMVSVYEDAYPIAAEPFAVSPDYYQEMIDAAENQAKSFVEEAAEIYRKHFPDNGHRMSTKVLRGSAAPQIIDEAESWGADMIVTGSHGRGFWGRMLGSVSDGVVHHAPCSVLVIRRPESEAEGQE